MAASGIILSDLPLLNYESLLNLVSTGTESDLLEVMQRLTAQFEAEYQALDKEVSKLECRRSQLSPRSQTATGVPPEFAGAIAHGDAILLLQDLIVASKNLDKLRRCILIDGILLVKALRRHPSHAWNSEMRLRTHPWFSAPQMKDLCSRLCESVRQVFLTYGQSKENRPAASHCAVCLELLASFCVRLPCSHRFCWSCLAEATVQELQSCPVCRSPTSLDPRLHLLDPSLTEELDHWLGQDARKRLVDGYENVFAGMIEVSQRDSPLFPSPLNGRGYPRDSLLSEIGRELDEHDGRVVRSVFSAEFPNLPDIHPSKDDTIKPAKALCAALNPNAKAFVPIFPIFKSLTTHTTDQDPPVFPPVVEDTFNAEDLDAIAKIRQATPVIRYSPKQLLALRPLNPNAAAFTPVDQPTQTKVIPHPQPIPHFVR